LGAFLRRAKFLSLIGLLRLAAFHILITSVEVTSGLLVVNMAWFGHLLEEAHDIEEVSGFELW
jgi:hypothetical protein